MRSPREVQSTMNASFAAAAAAAPVTDAEMTSLLGTAGRPAIQTILLLSLSLAVSSEEQMLCRDTDDSSHTL